MSDDTTFAGVPFDEAVRIVRDHQRRVRAEVRPATRWERLRLWWMRITRRVTR